MISNQDIEGQVQDNQLKLDEIKDPNQDKFLFFFTPEKVDKECMGGITLKNGVRILSVIVLYEAFCSLAITFDTKNTIKFILHLLLFILYLGIAGLALYSTFNDNLSLARFSYIALCVLFILKVLFYLLRCAIRLIEFINPWDGDFLKLKAITFILGKLAYLFIFLYFIYVLFCYIVSLKKSN